MAFLSGSVESYVDGKLSVLESWFAETKKCSWHYTDEFRRTEDFWFTLLATIGLVWAYNKVPKGGNMFKKVGESVDSDTIKTLSFLLWVVMLFWKISANSFSDLFFCCYFHFTLSNAILIFDPKPSKWTLPLMWFYAAWCFPLYFATFFPDAGVEHCWLQNFVYFGVHIGDISLQPLVFQKQLFEPLRQHEYRHLVCSSFVMLLTLFAFVDPMAMMFPNFFGYNFNYSICGPKFVNVMAIKVINVSHFFSRKFYVSCAAIACTFFAKLCILIAKFDEWVAGILRKKSTYGNESRRLASEFRVVTTIALVVAFVTQLRIPEAMVNMDDSAFSVDGEDGGFRHVRRFLDNDPDQAGVGQKQNCNSNSDCSGSSGDSGCFGVETVYNGELLYGSIEMEDHGYTLVDCFTTTNHKICTTKKTRFLYRGKK
jgi:hypothetical protein